MPENLADSLSAVTGKATILATVFQSVKSNLPTRDLQKMQSRLYDLGATTGVTADDLERLDDTIKQLSKDSQVYTRTSLMQMTTALRSVISPLTTHTREFEKLSRAMATHVRANAPQYMAHLVEMSQKLPSIADDIKNMRVDVETLSKVMSVGSVQGLTAFTKAIDAVGGKVDKTSARIRNLRDFTRELGASMERVGLGMAEDVVGSPQAGGIMNLVRSGLRSGAVAGGVYGMGFAGIRHMLTRGQTPTGGYTGTGTGAGMLRGAGRLAQSRMGQAAITVGSIAAITAGTTMSREATTQQGGMIGDTMAVGGMAAIGAQLFGPIGAAAGAAAGALISVTRAINEYGAAIKSAEEYGGVVDPEAQVKTWATALEQSFRDMNPFRFIKDSLGNMFTSIPKQEPSSGVYDAVDMSAAVEEYAEKYRIAKMSSSTQVREESMKRIAKTAGGGFAGKLASRRALEFASQGMSTTDIEGKLGFGLTGSMKAVMDFYTKNEKNQMEAGRHAVFARQTAKQVLDEQIQLQRATAEGVRARGVRGERFGTGPGSTGTEEAIIHTASMETLKKQRSALGEGRSPADREQIARIEKEMVDLEERRLVASTRVQRYELDRVNALSAIKQEELDIAAITGISYEQQINYVQELQGYNNTALSNQEAITKEAEKFGKQALIYKKERKASLALEKRSIDLQSLSNQKLFENLEMKTAMADADAKRIAMIGAYFTGGPEAERVDIGKNILTTKKQIIDAEIRSAQMEAKKGQHSLKDRNLQKKRVKNLKEQLEILKDQKSVSPYTVELRVQERTNTLLEKRKNIMLMLTRNTMEAARITEKQIGNHIRMLEKERTLYKEKQGVYGPEKLQKMREDILSRVETIASMVDYQRRVAAEQFAATTIGAPSGSYVMPTEISSLQAYGPAWSQQPGFKSNLDRTALAKMSPKEQEAARESSLRDLLSRTSTRDMQERTAFGPMGGRRNLVEQYLAKISKGFDTGFTMNITHADGSKEVSTAFAQSFLE